MAVPRVVIDTNVIVSALRSRRGWSNRLLLALQDGKLEICLSVPVILEYEEVVKRQGGKLLFSASEIEQVLDVLCDIAHHTRVDFRWTSQLPDPDDDMILEAAVSGGCQYIVTFNIRHFGPAIQFGVRIRTPKQFLLETRIEA